MVTIVDYVLREKDGEEFYCLKLQGGVELIKSSETGKFYAHAMKATITSTFNEVTCKSLIGQQLPGKIEKQPCEPYKFTTDTGEEVTLGFEYYYNAESTNLMEEVVEPEKMTVTV